MTPTSAASDSPSPPVGATPSGRGAFAGSPDLESALAADGRRWKDFRRQLRPDFGRLWRDLGFCALMLFGGYAGLLLACTRLGPGVGGLLALPAALWIGYFTLGLLSFAHEATHYNLNRDRGRNDRLAEWLLFPFLGLSVAEYRRSHWQHHLHLGGPGDTEVGYRDCLTPAYLATALTGISLVQALLRYSDAQTQESRSALLPRLWVTGRTLLAHGALLGVALVLGAWPAALGWAIGVFVVFPTLVKVRQLLEHRAFDASCDVDYATTPHGPVNRMFGSDPFSRYLGAAGFNRHLLHHWDPTVSYTCFDEMEAFLQQTPLAGELEAARSSYPEALRRMWAQARR